MTFQKGQLVVCIDNAPDIAFDYKAALLCVGTYYRIATVGEVLGQPAIGFRELPSDTPNRARAWHARRFRPLRANEAEAHEQWAAMLSNPQEVPA